MHAYVAATRSVLGCRTAAAATLGANALVRAVAAYGRGDYRNVRERVKAERTTLFANAVAIVQTVHVIAYNIDFAHRTFTAIDRALESAEGFALPLRPTASAGDLPGRFAAAGSPAHRSD